jgi:hypothetical protein
MIYRNSLKLDSIFLDKDLFHIVMVRIRHKRSKKQCFKNHIVTDGAAKLE